MATKKKSAAKKAAKKKKPRRRGGGRPPIPEDQRKTVRHSVLLTPAENSKLVAAAKKAGIPGGEVRLYLLMVAGLDWESRVESIPRSVPPAGRNSAGVLARAKAAAKKAKSQRKVARAR